MEEKEVTKEKEKGKKDRIPFLRFDCSHKEWAPEIMQGQVPQQIISFPGRERKVVSG